MEKTFQDQALDLALNAIKFIKSKVVDKLELIKPDENDEFDIEDLQVLPSFQWISKHSYALFYAIVALKNEGGRITVVGKELGEEGDIYEIGLEDLSNEETFILADHIDTD